MTTSAALAQWLADREAQARSFERLDALGKSWRALPLMKDMERELGAPGTHGPGELLAIARRFMDRGDALAALMRDLIAGSRADPFFAPPLRPMSSDIQTSLLLYNHPDLYISIGVTGADLLAAKKAVRQGPASINFTGQSSLLRFVRSGDCTLSFWEAPPITDSFVGSAAGPCRKVEERRMRDGEEIVCDGRYQSFVIEHAARDILFLQAVARAEAAPVGAEYDRDTLRFIGASSTDDASSRIQMMVSLLRTMGRDDAFPLFEESLASPHFHTRWYVMREMLAMDAEAALPALRRMAAGDPHPDVRAAAQETLGLFFGAGVEPAEPAESAEPCRA